MDTEITPRFSVVDGTLKVYDGPVEVNNTDYLIGVASLGAIGYVVAAFVLVYCLCSLLVRLVFRCLCSARYKKWTREDEGGLSLRFIDTVKLFSLTLTLFSFAASFVSILYGLEMIDISKRGMNEVVKVVKKQSGHMADLIQGMPDMLNLWGGSRYLIREIPRDFQHNVARVVYDNASTFDEAEVWSTYLIYLVPIVSATVMIFGLLAMFKNNLKAVRLLARIIPMATVVTSLYFGLSFALPSFYKDVCSESRAYIQHSTKTVGNFSASQEAFRDSVYPCQNATASRLSYNLQNMLKYEANEYVSELNAELESFAEKTGMLTSNGNGSMPLPLLCEPYEYVKFMKEDCDTLPVTEDSDSYMVKHLACSLKDEGGFFYKAEGDDKLSTLVYQERPCGYSDTKPQYPNVQFQYTNSASDFRKSAERGGYKGYKSLMSTHGYDLDQLASKAEKVTLAMSKSNKIIEVSNVRCIYSVEALKNMINDGERCERLDVVKHVFWISNLIPLFTFLCLALMVEMLKVAYADFESWKNPPDDSDDSDDTREVEMVNGMYGTSELTMRNTPVAPFHHSGYNSPVGHPNHHHHHHQQQLQSAPSAPPMFDLGPQDGTTATASRNPVMGYAVPMPPPHLNRVPSYNLPEPPLKVF